MEMETPSCRFNVALVIDEASLLRLEVFVALHTLCQFEMDSKPYLPIVLAGHTPLINNLRYPGCLPLASRGVAKSRFIGAKKQQMRTYLQHHQTIAGIDHIRRWALLGSNLSRDSRAQEADC